MYSYTSQISLKRLRKRNYSPYWPLIKHLQLRIFLNLLPNFLFIRYNIDAGSQLVSGIWLFLIIDWTCDPTSLKLDIMIGNIGLGNIWIRFLHGIKYRIVFFVYNYNYRPTYIVLLKTINVQKWFVCKFIRKLFGYWKNISILK